MDITESLVEIVSLFCLGEKASQQASSCIEGSNGRGQYQVCSRRTGGGYSDVHGNHSTRYFGAVQDFGFRNGMKLPRVSGNSLWLPW